MRWTITAGSETRAERGRVRRSASLRFPATTAGMQAAFGPQRHRAGPRRAVGPFGLADGQDALRLVGIMHRHPLRVGLRGLTPDRAAIGPGQCGERQRLRGVERREAVQTFVIPQPLPLHGFASAGIPGRRIRAVLLPRRLPRAGQCPVEELLFQGRDIRPCGCLPAGRSRSSGSRPALTRHHCRPAPDR